MNYPTDYIRYLAHFHGDRDYFECHEILEEYWKSLSDREDVWVGFIQIAVGLYHHRRENLAGAAKMLVSSANRLKAEDVERLGLDFGQLQSILIERIQAVRNKEAYTDLNLPISDPTLRKLAQEECLRNGWSWQAPSSKHASLIHRHTLRDRSDVIRERENNLRIKRHG